MATSGPCNIAVTITIAGLIVSFIFFAQKQQLDELQFFSKLFQDFNKRYHGLNDEMNRIAATQGDDKVSDEEEETLNKYFNLCGEEFLYYTKGYIDPVVWTAWKNGMRYFLEGSSRIEAKWRAEESESSYYGLTIKEIIS
jgi:hypothetical protein